MPCWSDCKQPKLAKRPYRPRECECRFPLSLCEAERGRQWVKIHGENHVCPSAIKKAKKARKDMLKKMKKDKKDKGTDKKKDKKKDKNKK